MQLLQLLGQQLTGPPTGCAHSEIAAADGNPRVCSQCSAPPRPSCSRCDSRTAAAAAAADAVAAMSVG